MTNFLVKNFATVSYQPPDAQVWVESYQVTSEVSPTLTAAKYAFFKTGIYGGADFRYVIGFDALGGSSDIFDANGYEINGYYIQFASTVPSGSLPSIIALTNADVIPGTTKTTTIPGYWSSVPQAAITIPQAIIGWDGSASSIPSFSGDGEASFSVNASNVGVVVGLNNDPTGSNYTNINYAIYASNGLYQAMENGVPLTAAAAHDDATVFKIKRLGTQVYYFADDVQFYQSATPSIDWVLTLDASLYASGDTVLNASLTDLADGITAPAVTLSGTGSVTVNSYQIGSALYTSGTLSGTSSVAIASYTSEWAGTVTTGGTGTVTLGGYTTGNSAFLTGLTLGGTGDVALSDYTVGSFGNGAGTLKALRGYASSEAISGSGSGSLPKMSSSGIGDGITINTALGVGVLRKLQSAGRSVTGGVGNGAGSLKALAAYGSEESVSGSGAGRMQALQGQGLTYTSNTNYLAGTVTLGTLNAYGYSQAPNGLDETVSFGTLEAYGGGVLDEIVTLGTLAAVGYNTNVAILDETITLGTLSASAVVGTIANADMEFRAGALEAYGAGFLTGTITLGSVSAEAIIGVVANGDIIVSLGTLAATGYVPNTATLDDVFFLGDFVNSGLDEVIFLGTVLARGGFAEDTSIAYCVNTTTGALTRYTNFGFKRIVRINNKYYGLKADGLYLLEGATDNGTTIDARARTGMFHANDYHIKRIQYAYLRENHFATNVGVTADDNDFYPTYTYLSAFNGKRVKFAMGVSGIYWDFEFSNVSGGGLNIGAVEFRTDVTSRKI